MIDKIIAIYSIIDDILKLMGHQDDERRIMTDTEVTTTAIVSALFFYSNLQKAMEFMKSSGLIKKYVV